MHNIFQNGVEKGLCTNIIIPLCNGQFFQNIPNTIAPKKKTKNLKSKKKRTYHKRFKNYKYNNRLEPYQLKGKAIDVNTLLKYVPSNLLTNNEDWFSYLNQMKAKRISPEFLELLELQQRRGHRNRRRNIYPGFNPQVNQSKDKNSNNYIPDWLNYLIQSKSTSPSPEFIESIRNAKQFQPVNMRRPVNHFAENNYLDSTKPDWAEYLRQTMNNYVNKNIYGLDYVRNADEKYDLGYGKHFLDFLNSPQLTFVLQNMIKNPNILNASHLEYLNNFMSSMAKLNPEELQRYMNLDSNLLSPDILHVINSLLPEMQLKVNFPQYDINQTLAHIKDGVAYDPRMGFNFAEHHLPAFKKKMALGKTEFSSSQKDFNPRQFIFGNYQNNSDLNQINKSADLNNFSSGQPNFRRDDKHQAPFHHGQATFRPGQTAYNSDQTFYKPGGTNYNRRQTPFHHAQKTFSPAPIPYNSDQLAFSPGWTNFGDGQKTFSPGQMPFSSNHTTFRRNRTDFYPDQTSSERLTQNSDRIILDPFETVISLYIDYPNNPRNRYKRLADDDFEHGNKNRLKDDDIPGRLLRANLYKYRTKRKHEYHNKDVFYFHRPWTVKHNRSVKEK